MSHNLAIQVIKEKVGRLEHNIESAKKMLPSAIFDGYRDKLIAEIKQHSVDINSLNKSIEVLSKDVN